MGVVMLKGPAGDYPLLLNLALVEVLEAESSLLAQAELLAARQMKLGDILRQLLRLYRYAGCDTAEALLEEFILTRQPAGMLADILVQILMPLKELGGAAGKPLTSA